MHGDDIVWVRSLSGYRLGVLLPKGFAFISSKRGRAADDVDGRSAEAGVCEPERPEQPGDDSRAQDHGDLSPRSDTDMFFDDVKTLYDLEAPEGGSRQGGADLQRLSQRPRAQLDTLAQLPLAGAEGDRSGHRQAVFHRQGWRRHRREAGAADYDDKQSAHIKITGAFRDPGYRMLGEELLVRPHALRASQTPCCCPRAGTSRPSRSRGRLAPTRGAPSSRSST